MNRIGALLSGDGPLVIPGVYDALSAKLAAEAGFRTVLISGYCLSATRLGEPDFGLLTQTEVLDAAARIVAAVDLPVLVDIDTGYGNAFNVERTVRAAVRGRADRPRSARPVPEPRRRLREGNRQLDARVQ